MHEGHRERVREKVRQNGLNGFSSHEIIELLLFYASRCAEALVSPRGLA